MKMPSILAGFTTAALATVILANPVQAGNQRLCSPMIKDRNIYVNFPNGSFTLAGDRGSEWIRSLYNNGTGKGVSFEGMEGPPGLNSRPERQANKLCHIDQARGVGAPATLIMIFGDKDHCGSWHAWAQVQSAVAYSGCDINGNTVTLK